MKYSAQSAEFKVYYLDPPGLIALMQLTFFFLPLKEDVEGL